VSIAWLRVRHLLLWGVPGHAPCLRLFFQQHLLLLLLLLLLSTDPQLHL
jgi:hypothetical protein